MSLYQLIVPAFTQMLQSLSAQLDKGAAHAEAEGSDPALLLSARLAPDMHPLSFQIRFACVQANEAVSRLTGGDALEVPTVATIDEAKALIAQTVGMLATAAQEEMDAAGDKPIELALDNGMTFDMKGADYVRDWAIPQFYFHLVTAYGILRHNGVELGKADYVRHMFAYLRPAAASTAG